MKTKQIPALTTLLAAAITCVISLIQGVSFSLFLKRLLIAVIVFLVLGIVAEVIVEWNFKPIQDEPLPEDKGDDMTVEENTDIDAEADSDLDVDDQ